MTLKHGPDYTLELYPDGDEPRGGIFRLQNDDYLQAEAHEEQGNYSILWPTERGVIDSIDTALRVFGGDGFITGAVGEKGTYEEGDAYGEGNAADVAMYVREEADLQKVCYIRLDGPSTIVIWGAPKQKFVDSEFSSAELSMMVQGTSKELVERIIAETALAGIAGRYQEAMNELAVVVPSLQQA